MPAQQASARFFGPSLKGSVRAANPLLRSAQVADGWASGRRPEAAILTDRHSYLERRLRLPKYLEPVLHTTGPHESSERSPAPTGRATERSGCAPRPEVARLVPHLAPHALDLSLHVEYVFSVFKMRLRKRTDTRIQNGWLLGRKSEYILTY